MVSFADFFFVISGIISSRVGFIPCVFSTAGGWGVADVFKHASCLKKAKDVCWGERKEMPLVDVSAEDIYSRGEGGWRNRWILSDKGEEEEEEQSQMDG